MSGNSPAPALDVVADQFRYEYLALVGSFILVGLEAVIRVLTLALRKKPPPYFMTLVSNRSSIICRLVLLSCVAAPVQQTCDSRTQKG